MMNLAHAIAALPVDAGWVVGYAAHTDCVFRNRDKARLEMFAHGCFERAVTDPIALGVNHAVCRCMDPGRSWKLETWDALIQWDLALASTRDGSLRVGEDPYGLWFAAQFRQDACVGYGDDPPINLHDAIARGQCAGVSIHIHGGDQVVGPTRPADVFVYGRAPVPELSLVLPPYPKPGSPGTWVMPVGPAARARAAACLKE